ncbi:MAG: dipeptidase [Planctomycetota bacterium]|jgi:acetylornithine deacetylase/succinyl-diaminopimelate desuccinylase-like protein
MSEPLQPVLKKLEADFEPAIERVSALLRIPSISTDPAYRGDVQRCAAHVADDLSSIGFESTVHETDGHPVVTARHAGPAGAPRVLYYGHYDVQPPDPLELWDSPPFEPTIVEGPHGRRLIARGAVDDKGQLMTFVEAFRAWRDVHGTLPVNVTVLLEGEEESGSPSLDPFLESQRETLSADVCVVSDTGMWDIDTPAVTYMLRGMVYVEVTLHGPSHDLHSGMYGGAVVNPANELARILGELRDARGVVQIPGFYDDVRELSRAESEQWSRLTFDEPEFLAHAGLKTPVGEAGRSTLQRIWSRPCCDINGFYGGYTGDGAKTIIPARASAKVSCRLVPDQDADKILDNIAAFFEQRTPADCRWEIKSHGASPAVRVPTDSPHLEATLKALETTYGRKPVLMGCGGSIPVVGSIQRILGFDSLLVGFSLDDDRVHSPNEKFELRCFEMGMRSHAAMLSTFAELAGKPARTPAAKSGAG